MLSAACRRSPESGYSGGRRPVKFASSRSFSPASSPASLNWNATNVLLPLKQVKAALAAGLSACRGCRAGTWSERGGVLALCLGTVIAYPVGWRMRLAGAAAGVALVLGLNTVRIGTLGLAAASPAWFNPLHLYVWPALLTLAVAGYVFGWMRFGDRALAVNDENLASRLRPATVPSGQTRRFVLLTGVFLLVFLAAAPLYLHSFYVLRVAMFIAMQPRRSSGLWDSGPRRGTFSGPRMVGAPSRRNASRAADPHLHGSVLRLLDAATLVLAGLGVLPPCSSPSAFFGTASSRSCHSSGLAVVPRHASTNCCSGQ